MAIKLVCVIEIPDVDTVEDAAARVALLDGGSERIGWLGKLHVYHASEAEADTAQYRQDLDCLDEPDDEQRY